MGALAATGQAPLGLWALTLIALACLYALFANAATLRRATLIGLAGGTGYFAVSLNWIVEPFLVDVARHGWMAPFALVFMAMGMALFWALGFGLVRWLRGGALAWIAALCATEALRGVIFTGFPWAQVGHVWIDTPMLHWAGVGGALLLCLITLGGAVALWAVCAPSAGHRRAFGAAGLALLGALYLGGPLVARGVATPPDAPVVRLIQPNAAQHEKWAEDKIQFFFDRQIEYTGAGARPDLVVWPETSVPVILNRAEGTLAYIAEAARGVPVVVGVQRFEGPRLFNSLALLTPEGRVDALYDKHHLVPFGEYIPFGDLLKRFGLRGLAAQDGNGYSSGPGARTISLGDLGIALPLICYEGVFPHDVAAAPERADFMLLITNDAWFGRLSGPYQHLAQARLRSAEQGLPMIRVANTGVSAMIDARGQITASLPLGQAGWLDAPLPPPRAPTVYALSGDAPVLTLMALVLGVAGWRGRRRGRAAH